MFVLSSSVVAPSYPPTPTQACLDEGLHISDRGFVGNKGWSDVHLTSLLFIHHHKFQSKEGKPLSKRQLSSLPLGSVSLPQGHRGQRSYEDFGEGVGSGAADVALSGVERHIVDRLVKLLPVSCELLNARLTLHVPKTDGAVVT